MTRADRILILLVVCTMPFVYFHLWVSDEPANYLVIRSGSNAPVTETLSPDRMLHIAGPLGESIVEINNGRTRFVSSPCTRQVCVHRGWLSNTDGLAACLPNRISMTLVSQHPRFDAINF
ncbi:MAG: NusG domain II-containing protein [Pseudomonadota bacterium]